MAQLIEITKVAVSPKNFMARVKIAAGGPLTTDQDLIGTTHVYNLIPEVCDHTCLGDAGTTFKDAMGATETAHLLEHVAIELMARTGIAGDISCGRTWEVTNEPRTYDIQLACPDDVLVASALSSAAWILQWAYSGGADPKPDVEAIVAGIRQLAETAPVEEPVSQVAQDGVQEPAAAEDSEDAEASVETPESESDKPEPDEPSVTTVAGAKFEDAEPAGETPAKVDLSPAGFKLGEGDTESETADKD